MPGGVYQNMVPALLPSYMRGPYLTTLAESFGVELDARAEQVLRGRLQGNPFAGGPTPSREGAARLADGRLIECEDFVLPIHAAQRGVVLYATEPPLSQRIRVSQWWQIAREDGTHWGEIDNVRPYFAAAAAYPQITIAFQTNEGTPAAIWYRVSPTGVRSITRVSPSNFDFEGQPAKRTQWLAFVDMSGTGYAAPRTYDSGGIYDTSGWTYDEGALPFTTEMAADIVAMFMERKSAASWCAGVVLMWSNPIDPTGTPVQDATGWWSLPNGKWGATIDPVTHLGTRPPTWQWIYDAPA